MQYIWSIGPRCANEKMNISAFLLSNSASLLSLFPELSLFAEPTSQCQVGSESDPSTIVTETFQITNAITPSPGLLCSVFPKSPGRAESTALRSPLLPRLSLLEPAPHISGISRPLLIKSSPPQAVTLGTKSPGFCFPRFLRLDSPYICGAVMSLLLLPLLLH